MKLSDTKITDFFLKVDTNALIELQEPFSLSPSFKNAILEMEQLVSDVTKVVVAYEVDGKPVNLSLSALHSGAKGEIEAHPSSVPTSFPNIPLEKLDA